MLGVVLPLLLVWRREVIGALQYARQAGIPPADRRLRAYRWLGRLMLADVGLCSATPTRLRLKTSSLCACIVGDDFFCVQHISGC